MNRKRNNRTQYPPAKPGENFGGAGNTQPVQRFDPNWVSRENGGTEQFRHRRSTKKKGRFLRRWNIFVMIVGYLALAYLLTRGVIWVLAELNGFVAAG